MGTFCPPCAHPPPPQGLCPLPARPASDVCTPSPRPPQIWSPTSSSQSAPGGRGPCPAWSLPGPQGPARTWNTGGTPSILAECGISSTRKESERSRRIASHPGSAPPQASQKPLPCVCVWSVPGPPVASGPNTGGTDGPWEEATLLGPRSRLQVAGRPRWTDKKQVHSPEAPGEP